MPTKYPISTLRDIFHLPTLQQMETCLEEMSQAMIQARGAADLMLASMKVLDDASNLEELTQLFDWPEVVHWIDDGLGEVTCQFKGPDDKVLFSVTTNPAES